MVKIEVKMINYSPPVIRLSVINNSMSLSKYETGYNLFNIFPSDITNKQTSKVSTKPVNTSSLKKLNVSRINAASWKET